MKAGITNAYVQTLKESTLVIESTIQVPHTLKRKDPKTLVVELPVKLIMAQDILHIYDGLINTVEFRGVGDKSYIKICLEHPSPYRTERIYALPEKLTIAFNRDYIGDLLEGKVVLVDPGHGGPDRGWQGRAKLLEKDVVKDIALNLKEILFLHGACPILTREKDVYLSDIERIKIAQDLQADIFISLHTHWSEDVNTRGSLAYYAQEEGKILCGLVLQELNKKMGLSSLGVFPQSQDILNECKNFNIAWAWIEACTISNMIEEGSLRSPVFKKRLAQAIMNGLVEYVIKMDR